MCCCILHDNCCNKVVVVFCTMYLATQNGLDGMDLFWGRYIYNNFIHLLIKSINLLKAFNYLHDAVL